MAVVILLWELLKKMEKDQKDQHASWFFVKKKLRRPEHLEAIGTASFTERWASQARKAAIGKRRRKRGELNNHVCQACGSISGRGQLGNDSSSYMSTDQDVEDSRSDNAQKVSDQSGASKTFGNSSPGQSIIIEEKLVDRPRSTLRRQRRAKPKSDLSRRRLSYGSLSRTKLEIEANRKTLPKRRSETTLPSREAEAGIRGLAVDTEASDAFAFCDSPNMRTMTGEQHWSDDLIDLGGEPSYSGNESNMSLNLIESVDRNSLIPAPNSSPEHWMSQYPRDWFRTSHSSSSSVREFGVDSDILQTIGLQPPKRTEKPRGRLEHRADVGKRMQNEYRLGRNRLKHSRVKSMPESEGKLMQMPSMNLNYGALRKHKGSLPESDLNYKTSILTSISTNTAESNLQEISGDAFPLGTQV